MLAPPKGGREKSSTIELTGVFDGAMDERILGRRIQQIHAVNPRGKCIMITPTLTYTTIRHLSEVTTSRVREMQWSIDYWQQQYAEAGAASGEMWRLYDAAIDNPESTREEKNDLLVLAQMFDENKRAAWWLWQNAKRNYLALCN